MRSCRRRQWHWARAGYFPESGWVNDSGRELRKPTDLRAKDSRKRNRSFRHLACADVRMFAHQPVSTLDAKTPKCHLRIGMSGRKRTSPQEGTWDRPANIRKSPEGSSRCGRASKWSPKAKSDATCLVAQARWRCIPKTLGGTHNGARVPNQEHYVTE